jgi:hypothetical protein
VHEHERITQFVDTVVAGLKDDPELMLDARAELMTHLEDEVESHQREGTSEDDSIDLALKTFGPATDTAGDLVRANARRMRLHGLARLAIQAAVIPLACIVALVVVVTMCQRMRIAPTNTSLAPAGWLRPSRIWPSLTDDARFTLKGDRTRDGSSQRDRAIWEAEPDNPVYYGNYISELHGDFTYGDSDETVPLDYLEAEFAHAEEVDPDNARYPYLLAACLAERACEINGHSCEDEDEAYSLVVLDRPLLEQAMLEVVRAEEKHFYRTYTDEMYRQRLDLLPVPRRLGDYLARYELASVPISDDMTPLLDLVTVIPLYGELLAEEGHVKGAQPFLDAWRPVARMRHKSAESIEDFFAANIIACRGAFASAEVYDRLGRHEEAERMRADIDRFRAPYLEFRDRHRGNPDYPATIDTRAAAHVGFILPGTVTENALTPGRWTEYVVVEQRAVAALLIVMAILILDAALVALRWRWARGATSAPILLLPGWKVYLRILALSVVAPLVAYFIFTRWTPWAGRDVALRHMIDWFSLQVLIPGAVIVGLSCLLSISNVVKRCRALRVPMPSRKRVRVGLLKVTACLLLSSAAMFGAVVAEEPGVGWGMTLARVLTVDFVVLLQIILLYYRPFARKEYGLFYGTVARSVVPVLAIAVMLLGGVVQPYLRATEVQLIQEDTVAWPDARYPGGYKHHAEFVERVKPLMVLDESE